MRSSKSRSRSKSNRNRSVGNVVNRVFDSSGPEGKVRGTPQQVIDKYNQLARDAQLGGDRVATENFQQHSEHYTRMLAEAQREQEARRVAQEAQHRERQQQAEARNERHDRAEAQPPQADTRAETAPIPEGAPQPELSTGARAPSVREATDEERGGDSGLVETPESKPAPRPRTRRPRKTQPSEDKSGGEPGPAEAAE